MGGLGVGVITTGVGVTIAARRGCRDNNVGIDHPTIARTMIDFGNQFFFIDSKRNLDKMSFRPASGEESPPTLTKIQPEWGFLVYPTGRLRTALWVLALEIT
jgi:hypothetical protein